MSNAATTTSPRAADVARWVATMAAPVPSDYEARRKASAAREYAQSMLTHYRLDAQGNPKT